MDRSRTGPGIAGLILVTFGLTSATGQTPTTGQSPAVGQAAPVMQAAQFDADHDGRISRREFIRGRAARFTELDRDRDGILREADFPGMAPGAPLAPVAGRLLENADLDRDGDITREEIDLSGTPIFDRADRDADGFVDGPETERLIATLNTPQ